MLIKAGFAFNGQRPGPGLLCLVDDAADDGEVDLALCLLFVDPLGLLVALDPPDLGVVDD